MYYVYVYIYIYIFIINMHITNKLTFGLLNPSLFLCLLVEPFLSWSAVLHIDCPSYLVPVNNRYDFKIKARRKRREESSLYFTLEATTSRTGSPAPRPSAQNAYPDSTTPPAPSRPPRSDCTRDRTGSPARGYAASHRQARPVSDSHAHQRWETAGRR